MVTALICLAILAIFIKVFDNINTLKEQNNMLFKKIEKLENEIYFGKNPIKQKTNQQAQELEVSEKSQSINARIEEKPKVITIEKPKTKISRKPVTVSIPGENSKFMQIVLDFVLKGNPLVKIGGLILFIGLAFLLKLTISNNLINMKMVTFLVAITGLIIVYLGFRYRKKRELLRADFTRGWF